MNAEQRWIYEHLLFPGLLLNSPPYLVTLDIQGVVTRAFGFYSVTLEELEDGCLYRATQMLEVSWVDPALNTCTATVTGPGGRSCSLVYDADNYGFRDKKYVNHKIGIE